MSEPIAGMGSPSFVPSGRSRTNLSPYLARIVPSSACEGQLYARDAVPSVATCLWRDPSGLLSQTLLSLIKAMLDAIAEPGRTRARARARAPRSAARAGEDMPALTHAPPGLTTVWRTNLYRPPGGRRVIPQDDSRRSRSASS